MAARIGPIAIVVDQKAMARADKRLAGYMGRPLERRAQQAYIEGARLMVKPARQQAPVGKTGNLRRSIAASRVRLRPGEMAGASVAARPSKRGGHRHLVIRGHRIVTHLGRDTGLRSRPNPFIDRAYAAVGEQVRDYIATRTLAVTGESFRAF